MSGINRPYNEDPDLPDENVPEFRDEMFQVFRHLGWKPEDLIDREYANAYAEWLKSAPPKDD